MQSLRKIAQIYPLAPSCGSNRGQEITDFEFLSHSPYGLSGYCFHLWCPGGWAGGGKSLPVSQKL